MDPILIADLRGGRNGTDPPSSLPETQCVEALNVDWAVGTLAHKRNGATVLTETGGTAFTLGIHTLIRHVPGATETAAELWGIDNAATPIVKRLTGGTSFANVTVDDAIATKPELVAWATLNGKLFLAYDSTQDRLHVYDPNLASPRVRRVGLATPGAAPTVANTGAGAYAATIRYYRVRWLQFVSPTIHRRSEYSAVVSFTPSGAGTAARVTQPTPPGEGETHWEVEGSADNLTFYTIAGSGGISAAVAIATTTFDDSTVPGGYTAGTLSMTAGLCTVPTSAKYLLSDGNRLLMAGGWETGAKNSRVWFTPVLGSADVGDDERIPNTTTQKNWVDLNENDGGAITGMGGPLEGCPWVFKYRQIWKLIPTGDVDTPYLPQKRTDGIGCLSHRSIVVAEDEGGQPALYFMSARGPYRIGVGGLQYLGRDNEDIWQALSLEQPTVTCFALWHADLHQVWFYLATTSSVVATPNTTNMKLAFDVRLGRPGEGNTVRGGWAKHTGGSCSVVCGTMFANTVGANMSRDLKPYVGRGTSVILKADSTSLTDGGTTFQAYITTKPLPTVDGFLRHAGVGEPTLLALAADDTWILATITRDFGLETRAAYVQLTPFAGETRVSVVYEGLELSGALHLQVTLGDAAAVAKAWTLDRIMVPVIAEESA